MKYVTWTDRFMSDWGHAEGRTNRCYFGPVPDEVAEEIVDLIRGTRRDWYRFRVTNNPPRNSTRTLVSYIDLRGWLKRIAPDWLAQHSADLTLAPTWDRIRGYVK